MKNLVYILSCFLLLWGCNQTKEVNADETEEASFVDDLGEISIQVTGMEAAQPHFKNGLLLLHSFEYEDAREEFQAAQEVDPNFVMAYWGEAMTHNHNLWKRQNKEQAVAALKKLGESSDDRLVMAATPLEKDFLTSVEILYGQDADPKETKYERDLAYRDQLEAMNEKYPDNHEVAALFAISVLGSSRNGRDAELYDKTASVVQGIIDENPNHPGALHYLIHSYDDPGHAALAKSAADSYSKVAPDATHALHMPSHIYVALGQWDDVVESNIASWNASIKRMKRKQIVDRSHHAFNWLQYGFLQRGEHAKAGELLNRMVEFTAENPNKGARGYLLSMKGAQMVETDTWDGPIADIPVKIDDMGIIGRTEWSFIEGMKAFKNGEKEALNEIIKTVEKSRFAAGLNVGEKGFAMCSSAGFGSNPTQLGIDMAEVMELQLRARLATLKGDLKASESFYKQASDLDSELSYSFGPPAIFKPAHEDYADWLMEQERFDEALKIYEKSLKRNPRRLLSLKGRVLAAEQLGMNEALAEVKQELSKSLEERAFGEIL